MGMSEGKQRIMRASDKLLRKPDNPYKKERQLIQNNINKTFRDIRDCLFGTYLTNSQIEKVVKESEEKKNEKQCESEKGSDLELESDIESAINDLALLSDLTEHINEEFVGLNIKFAYKEHNHSIVIPDDHEEESLNQEEYKEENLSSEEEKPGNMKKKLCRSEDEKEPGKKNEKESESESEEEEEEEDIN